MGRLKSFFTLLFLFSVLSVFAASPIKDGFWVKLKVNAEGVYRLEYQDLVNAGFDMNNLDPRNLKLLGHQGGMLPEKNNEHQAGLPEIPVFIFGEDDGKFDNNDYLLFYGGGLSKWVYNTGTEKFEHRSNLYSNEAFLYLGVSSGKGRRLLLEAEVVQAPNQTITEYSHLYFHDSDMYNPLEMGRTWIGEKLGNETLKRSLTIPVPNGCKDSAYVKIQFAGGMKTASGTFITGLNGNNQSYSFSALNEDFESFRTAQRVSWLQHNNQNINVTLELIRPNTQSSAWLDFVEMNVLRSISYVKPLVLRHPDYFKSGVFETRINGSGTMVWNVSDEMYPSIMKVNAAGGYDYFRSNGGPSGSTFVCFNPNNCFKPEMAGRVLNQDIVAGRAAEFIIITHPDFAPAALELSKFRSQNNGYSVKVVQVQQIYNQYSCSQQDIVAIRDYLKDEYNKSKDSGTELKYVLLMGSTSYDPKNRVAGNTNFIPIYQAPSIYKSATFCLDDFYTYFEPAGGVPGAGNNQMALAIGRIPARNIDEAWAVVNKLKRYDSKEALGPWRTEIGFVCDDVDDSWELEFLQESEKYSNFIDKGHPDLLLNKIYTDAFKQQSTGNTEKYPEVSSEINRTMNKGALMMNYQGHGGEKGWAQEGILSVPMINAWNNKNFMPVMFTATCEFSRYDNPGLQSAGEHALLNGQGGAIALMSTTRLVFVSGNSQINYDFWSNYGFPKPNEPIPTVGSLYRKLKNRPTITSEDNKFALLGDPSMRMAFPEHHVVLDTVNGKPMSSFNDTLKAFSVVKMKGHIEKRAGGKFTDFDGNLWVKVFDKPQTQFTLDNDKNGSKAKFVNQNSFIFKGIVTVEDGEFEIVFAIPKDISYNVDSGKIAMYAHNGVTDANGAEKLLIGGSVDQVTPDYDGPVVALFMNDTTFVSGGATESNAIFIAKVFDKSGINATGAGIGRDMVAILDEGTDGEVIVLNEYFNYGLNSYTRGEVKYPFEGLSTGEHTIKFKVWDIHNNSAEKSISFVVLPDVKFKITSSLAKPNPFRDEVRFEFEHNLSGDDLKVTLVVSDQGGRQVAQLKDFISGANSVEDRIVWDGSGSSGNPVGPGMYFYSISLEATDGRKANFNGKLIKY